ncbi:MAG TPA: AhpC/TSA family protein, partial [Thermomicrobiales bacterium]|nr:AhpC/TSA family protein [Thermomicrobiales bacterium]
PILADPDRAAFRAYGLVEAGAGQFLTPAAGKAMVGALLRGNRGGRPVGDVRQLGGAFVVDRGGTVRWAKPSAFVGDHASPEELIAAAREA